MLPHDLLNELLTLLDDAETYRTFAMSSHITSQLCRKDMVNAKKRFTMFRTDRLDKWYSLPDSTTHGPSWSSFHASYVVYLNGKREGLYWEWNGSYPTAGAYCTSHYQNGLLHGKYVRWHRKDCHVSCRW